MSDVLSVRLQSSSLSFTDAMASVLYEPQPDPLRPIRIVSMAQNTDSAVHPVDLASGLGALLLRLPGAPHGDRKIWRDGAAGAVNTASVRVSNYSLVHTFEVAATPPRTWTDHPAQPRPYSANLFVPDIAHSHYRSLQ